MFLVLLLSKSIFGINFLNPKMLGVFLPYFFALFLVITSVIFSCRFTAFSDICKCFEKVSELALPSVHR